MKSPRQTGQTLCGGDGDRTPGCGTAPLRMDSQKTSLARNWRAGDPGQWGYSRAEFRVTATVVLFQAQITGPLMDAYVFYVNGVLDFHCAGQSTFAGALCSIWTVRLGCCAGVGSLSMSFHPPLENLDHECVLNPYTSLDPEPRHPRPKRTR